MPQETWMPIESKVDSFDSCEDSRDSRIAELENIVSYLINKDESDDIQRKCKQEYVRVQRDKQKKLKPSTGFIKVHKLINQRAVIDKMFKPLEERMLFKLIPFCNLESNFICDVDGMPMNQKSIIKLTGMTKNDVIEIMGNLLEYGVITKFIQGRNTYYKFSKDWIGN